MYSCMQCSGFTLFLLIGCNLLNFRPDSLYVSLQLFHLLTQFLRFFRFQAHKARVWTQRMIYFFFDTVQLGVDIESNAFIYSTL